MKISISLSEDLVRYMDERVDNRSQLIESLLKNWQKQQHDRALLDACLALDESADEDEEIEWQQAAITDWEAFG